MPLAKANRSSDLTSYWLDEPAPPIPERRLDGPPDVVVVGGGVTGCAAALRLAEAGLTVRLHDAREIAGGASGRNGGFALRGGAAPYDVTVETIGREQARDYWRRTEQALDRLEGLAGDALRAAPAASASPPTTRSATRSRSSSRRCARTVSPPTGSRSRWTAGSARRSSTRGDAALQPARWVRRLAVLAAEAGVEIREHSRVESLDGVEADQVLVATDGYPSGLLGQIEGLIVPTRGQMIATEPLAERLFDCPHYGRHGFDYWQQTPDGRILAGGFRDSALQYEFTTDEETTPGHPGRAGGVRRRARRPAGRASTTAGPGSSGWCSTSCPSSAASPAKSECGWRAATRATATCSACFAASSSRRRCSGARRPSSPCSILRACSSLGLRGRRDRLVALEERERVALGVLAAREPADRRDRLLVVRGAAGLADLREGGVDVLGGEVDDRPAAGVVPL